MYGLSDHLNGMPRTAVEGCLAGLEPVLDAHPTSIEHMFALWPRNPAQWLQPIDLQDCPAG